MLDARELNTRIRLRLVIEERTVLGLLRAGGGNPGETLRATLMSPQKLQVAFGDGPVPPGYLELEITPDGALLSFV